jgi:hypothetical protein
MSGTHKCPARDSPAAKQIVFSRTGTQPKDIEISSQDQFALLNDPDFLWMMCAFTGAERIFEVIDAPSEAYQDPDAVPVPEIERRR